MRGGQQPSVQDQSFPMQRAHWHQGLCWCEVHQSELASACDTLETSPPPFVVCVNSSRSATMPCRPRTASTLASQPLFMRSAWTDFRSIRRVPQHNIASQYASQFFCGLLAPWTTASTSRSRIGSSSGHAACHCAPVTRGRAYDRECLLTERRECRRENERECVCAG